MFNLAESYYARSRDNVDDAMVTSLGHWVLLMEKGASHKKRACSWNSCSFRVYGCIYAKFGHEQQ